LIILLVVLVNLILNNISDKNKTNNSVYIIYIYIYIFFFFFGNELNVIQYSQMYINKIDNRVWVKPINWLFYFLLSVWRNTLKFRGNAVPFFKRFRVGYNNREHRFLENKLNAYVISNRDWWMLKAIAL
jgi:hypothetical protein